MGSLTDFRAQHPEYNDMSDSALSDALYRKFYSDMPRDQYDAKMGVDSGNTQMMKGQRGITPPPKPDPGLFGEGGFLAHGGPFDRFNARLVNAATFGLSDEASGLARASGEWVKRQIFGPSIKDVVMNGGNPPSFASDYEKGANEDRAMQEQFGKEHPIAATATDILGAFGGMKAPVQALVPLATAGATKAAQAGRYALTMGKAAAAGAGVGALSGFASGQGLEDRLGRAESSAAAGALLGGAAKPLADTAGAGWSALKTVLGVGNDNAAAQRMVLAALQKDGLTPQDAARKFSQWRMAGAKPETLAELGGDATRRLARAVYTVGGKGASDVEQFYRGRADNRLDRVMGDAAADIGPERNVVQEVGGLPAQHQAEVDAANTHAAQGFRDVTGQRQAGGQTVAQASGETIRAQLAAQRDALETARRRAANPAYGEVESSPAVVNVDPVMETVASKLARFDNTEIGSAVEGARRTLTTSNGALKTQMDQLQGSLETMRDIQTRLAASGQRKAALHVGDVADSLEAQINAADDSLRQAKASYREASVPLDPYTKPEAGHAAGVLKQDQYRQGYLTDPEQVTARYFNSGKTAASDMQEFQQLLGNNPRAVTAMRQHIADDALAAATDTRGRFSVARLQRWREAHADALAQFPQAAQDLDTWSRRVAMAEGTATNSGPARSLRAIESGRSFMEADPEAIRALTGNMTPAELDLYRQGAMRALRDGMGGGRGTAELMAAYENSARHTNLRNRIAAVFGDTDTYRRFADLASREAQMAKTERFVLGGSQTTNKAEDVGSGALADAATDLVSSGGSLRPVITKSIMRMAARGKGVTKGRAAALAPYFTATGSDLSAGLGGLSANADQRALEQYERVMRLLGLSMPAGSLLGTSLNRQ